MTRKNYKKIVDKIVNRTYHEICTMDKKTVHGCLRTIKKYSTSNCGWTNYEMKNALIQMLKVRLANIKFLTRKKKK